MERLHNFIRQFSEEFLLHEKLNSVNTSMLLMAWNKIHYKDLKHFTLVSVSLEDEDFYENSSGSDIANIM